MPAAPTVSIVIVNWNGWRDLPACLDSLAGQTYRDVEVIVVDNASTDGSVAGLRRDYPAVRLIENSANLHFAAANNAALPRCRGRYIGLLNTDTAADPGWLAALVAALDAHPRAAGACGTIVALDDPRRVLFTTPKIDPRSGRAVWVNQPAPPCRVDSLSGNSLLLRRSAIDHIGPLDAAYLAYYEETDWCARALRAGYDLLYVPAAVCAHRERGSAPGGFHAEQMARNQLRFVLKTWDGDQLAAGLTLALADLFWEALRGLRDGRPGSALLPARALAWNLRRLAETLAARRRDLARLGPDRRSYHRSLPLRDRASDGRGGLLPPLSAG